MKRDINKIIDLILTTNNILNKNILKHNKELKDLQLYVSKSNLFNGYKKKIYNKIKKNTL